MWVTALSKFIEALGLSHGRSVGIDAPRGNTDVDMVLWKPYELVALSMCSFRRRRLKLSSSGVVIPIPYITS